MRPRAKVTIDSLHEVVYEKSIDEWPWTLLFHGPESNHNVPICLTIWSYHYYL